MIILTFIFLALMLLFPLDVSSGVADALNVCLKSVIPSLFPFMVASNLILSLNKNENNPFIKSLSRLFKISPPGVYALILGLLCGYPIGGKTALELYDKKTISETEKNRLVILANNAGPGFVISTVGGAFFKDIRAGVVIYISHILASLTFGLITAPFTKIPRHSKISNISEEKPFLADCIKKSIESVINITGIICFFSAITTLINKIPPIASWHYKGIIYGLLEITSGIKLISATHLNLRLKCAVASFIISFSGLSICLQLKSFSDKINTAPYFLARALCGLFAFIYCFFLI